MKILIDLQSCQSGSRFGGIGRYSIQLTKHIAKNRKEHDVHLLLNGTLLEGVQNIFEELISVIPKQNIHMVMIPKDIKIQIPNNHSFEAEVIREQYISNINPDIIFITSVFEGMLEEVVVSVKKYYDIPTVAIMYDLIPYAEPDIFLKRQEDKDSYMSRFESMMKVDRMFSISKFTKDEVIRLTGINPERIVNISTAVENKDTSHITSSLREGVLKEFNITKPFIMFTSSFCQRKNHRGLIEAFAKLPVEIKNNYQVVFVGNSWQEKRDELWNIAKHNKVSKESIIITKKIEDKKMYAIYQSCYLFVYPSLYEGFGMPALEAMLLNIPTIASNTTSLPEVVGMEEALFDPTDTDDIARLMLKGLIDTDFRKRLIDNANKQSKKFSWDKSSMIAIEEMEKLLALDK